MNTIKEKKRNILLKLFRGELSLAITFWLWFILGGVIVKYLPMYIFLQIEFENSGVEKGVYFILLSSVLMYLFFVMIGLWRSATNYKNSRLLSLFVKAIIVLHLSSTLYDVSGFRLELNDKSFLLQQEIAVINAKLPYRVSENVSIIKATLDNKNLFYTYKVNFERNKIGFTSKNLMREGIENGICSNSSTLEFLEEGFIFNYTYVDKEEKSFIKSTIDLDFCKKQNMDEEILKELLSRN